MKAQGKNKVELNVDIMPCLTYSAVACAPFDEAKKALERRGYQIISLSVNANLRIQQGKEAYISKNGNWVREGAIFIPGKGNKLVRESPVLHNAKRATQANREGKEFYISGKLVEEALEDFVDFPLANTTAIPTDRFNENDLTVWAFGEGDSKKAQVYGDFLKSYEITEMPILAVDNSYVNSQDKPFVRQLWFDWLDGRSNLDGYSWNLHCDNRVRGVRYADAKGVVAKKSTQ